MKWVVFLFYCFCYLLISIIIVLTMLNFYVYFHYDNYITKSIKKLPQAEVGIILGASVRSSKLPSKILIERLEKGSELYRSRKIQKILISGDSSGMYYDEVVAMQKFILKKNIPPKNILLDPFGTRTFNSMLHAHTVFHIKSAIIVTQAFHLYRSLFIADKLGIQVCGLIADTKENRNMKYWQLREFFAMYLSFYDLILYYLK